MGMTLRIMGAVFFQNLIEFGAYFPQAWLQSLPELFTRRKFNGSNEQDSEVILLLILPRYPQLCVLI